MYTLENGNIDPNGSIGPFRLGMRWEEVTAISRDFEIHSIGTSFEVLGGNIRLAVNTTTQQVFHITVWGVFQGKLDGWLGIGTSWKNVNDRDLAYHQDDLCLYVLDQYPQMYFELGDTDSSKEWCEAGARIVRLGVNTPDCELLM